MKRTFFFLVVGLAALGCQKETEEIDLDEMVYLNEEIDLEQLKKDPSCNPQELLFKRSTSVQ